MGVTVSEREYANFGKCIFLENGAVKLGITVDMGPRIIYFSLNGRENIMFEDRDRKFTEMTDDYGEWVNYGGHRLWCSPEVNPETYYPDNAPVDYVIGDGEVTVTPKPTPFGKSFQITVSMDSTKPVVTVTHKIKNVSGKPSRYAAWSITGLTAGGVCKVPVNTEKTGYLANRVLSLWDYADVYDPRFKMTNTEIRLRQDAFMKKAFKIGLNVKDGFAAYAVNEQIFVKSVPDHRLDIEYPDFSCNFETYTNGMFLECENIGEIREYQDGEEAVISEKWMLLDNPGDVEPEIEKIRSCISGS